MLERLCAGDAPILSTALHPLFFRVMEAIPDAKHDSLTRSVYYNVDSVPKSGHDAFDTTYHGPRVPAAGNPPHVDIKEFDEGVLECVGMCGWVMSLYSRATMPLSSPGISARGGSHP